MRDCPKKAYKAFQFTPLREGRQYAASWIEQLGGFSIHAPPRGATAEAFELYASFKIFSIHAPPRGATRNTESGANQGEKISIHAPPRGATAQTRTEAQPRSISIHAPPRGVTSTTLRFCVRTRFQFTPLREGQRWSGGGYGVVLYFNSRPSGGATLSFQAWGTVHTISIHAPPRGATTYFPTCHIMSCISIHAPPRGATLCTLLRVVCS